MFRFFIVFSFISTLLVFSTAFTAKTNDAALADPEGFARRYVECLRKQDSVAFEREFVLTVSDFEGVLQQFVASAMVSPEDKGNLPDAAKIKEVTEKYRERQHSGYASALEFFKNNQADLSTLQYEHSFYTLRRRTREPVIVEMEISIQVKDANSNYYLLVLDKIILLNGSWKGGLLDGIEPVDEYSNYSGVSDVMTDTAAATAATVEEYYDAEAVAVPLSKTDKKREKIYRKIDKLYDKINAIE